jgi:pyruvate kinase
MGTVNRIPAVVPVAPSDSLEDLSALLHELQQLRQRLLHAEKREAKSIDAVEPRHRYSAINLVHYVEFRSHDVRGLQARLTAHGLSSLGRTESHVLGGIDAVIETLESLTGHGEAPHPRPVDATDGTELLSRNGLRLLGPEPEDRPTRIMVTLPSEAASDYATVRTMLASGMDIARINCAHDDPETWNAMIANIRAAESELGKECLVSMDLGGPKLRTGPLVRGPEVLKVKPVRSELGVVLEPATVWLGKTLPGTAGPESQSIPVRDSGWARNRRVGEKVHLVDARGSRRVLTVEQVHGSGCLVSFRKTIYFAPGVTLVPQPSGSGKGGRKRTKAPTRVGVLPSAESSMTVSRGDQIVLTADMTPAEVVDGTVHRIGSTLFEVFADTEPGNRVLIDDGKIATVITDVTVNEVTVEVRGAGVAGTKLRAEKGINLPDSTLTLSALTGQDLKDLDFVKKHANIVEMSFVRSPKDIAQLLHNLDPVEDHALGIVLKIETVAAFDALPQILLEAMRWGEIGVMIARGDLAVEAGFERLAELQEEILWLSEAAHAPVIWATQVLDEMARTGVPSRAEVTDAAMAERAECVMLNKGPYIGEAIVMLADILRRMQDHMQKKRSLLRRLTAWDLDPETPADRR